MRVKLKFKAEIRTRFVQDHLVQTIVSCIKYSSFCMNVKIPSLLIEGRVHKLASVLTHST